MEEREGQADRILLAAKRLPDDFTILFSALDELRQSFAQEEWTQELFGAAADAAVRILQKTGDLMTPYAKRVRVRLKP